MKFEFTAYPDFNFLKSFAEAFSLTYAENKLIIPEETGSGSIRKIDLDEGFKLLIHHYTFQEVFVLKRKAPEKKNELVSIIFYTTALPNNYLSNEQKSFTCTKINNSSIEISSGDLNSEIRFPAGAEIHFTVVGIDKPVLKTLLNLEERNNAATDLIFRKGSSFLFHENMWMDMQKILSQITLINEREPLSTLHFKIKIQELIYQLFGKLLKRGNQNQLPLNNSEVDHLFAIRTAVLADLGTPPRLVELAKMANMSQTRMKVLFKQVFGDSIYNYFQTARMEEAAFLLKQSGYSVSEVGYQLGFTNLSHFSRLFKKHYGMTPKRYALDG